MPNERDHPEYSIAWAEQSESSVELLRERLVASDIGIRCGIVPRREYSSEGSIERVLRGALVLSATGLWCSATNGG